MAVFIWTAKVDRRKIGLVLVAAVLLCAVAVFAAGGLEALSSGVMAAKTATSQPANSKGVKTEEDRLDYLAQWGWLTGPEAVSVEELELPKEFGADYEQYLMLQTNQGFNLTKYAGKRIKRYTYDVLNYPGGVEGVQVHLLMRKNTVIGGEVLGPGFLHGLQMPTG